MPRLIISFLIRYYKIKRSNVMTVCPVFNQPSHVMHTFQYEFRKSRPGVLLSRYL